jgi:hypothetical protein
MAHYDPDAKPKQPKPKFKQLLVSDYTIEALHHIHDINKRGVGLYKDELVGFLNDMNKYRKGSDEQFWLESFNNGNYTVNRVTKEPIMINNICINMIGTIQNEVLNRIVTEYQGNGLIDRFLFTSSENKVYPLTDIEIDDKFSEYWNDILLRMNQNWIYRTDTDTEVIQMTSSAFKLYQDIDLQFVGIQNSEDESQDIKNYLSKMKTYVPRFALILAMSESIISQNYIIVDEKHMINAGRLADYFVQTARNVFDATALSKDIKEVSSNMRGMSRDQKCVELYKKDFTAVDISKFFNISKRQFYRIIQKHNTKE